MPSFSKILPASFCRLLSPTVDTGFGYIHASQVMRLEGTTFTAMLAALAILKPASLQIATWLKSCLVKMS